MPTSPPDPIVEQLAANINAALAGVTKTAGYTGDLNVIRATTSTTEIDPSDLKTVIWQENPRPMPAPYGQVGRKQIFAIVVYIREGETTGVPIDRRINLVVADIERALMADPRRGGICYIDNVFGEPSLEPNNDRFSSVWIFLQCDYRTLRSDPRKIAPAATNEAFFQGGTVLLLARYTSQRTIGAWQRFQDLMIMPLIEPRVATAEDDREGLSRPVEELYVGYRQKYEIEGEQISPEILVWRLGGGAIEQLSRMADPIVAAPHLVAEIDAVVPLYDLNSSPVFLIDSVETVTDATGATTYDEGTDYIADAESLKQGFIKIPAGSSIPGGSVIKVSFTPTAFSGRPVFDVAMAPSFRVRARIIWLASDGQVMVHGDFDGSIVAQSVTNEAGMPSTTKLHLTVLDDGSANRCGRMVLAAGPLPAGSGY